MANPFPYPRHKDGYPVFLRIPLQITQSYLIAFERAGLACAQYLEVGDWVMGHLSGIGAFVAENVLPALNKQECEISCRIQNRLNGYTEKEIKIINWQRDGNSVIMNDKMDVIFLPGPIFGRN